ncbi:MAG: bifunctional metallophosphatase/5'-nucleotidase [Candidatus Eisenbacteria bacterium]|uniref:Bifunctional metallophosphatase/5'-nucleotidase n=1 Tax=Eiseniibacteriota bacterium TaxID=2212470 RepID=A0A7Y2ECN8_UNCEI|nr:bifunctional metallophosphatase/5'-nucleotidase [Candidatus Eisenbacteria bacterium]
MKKQLTILGFSVLALFLVPLIGAEERNIQRIDVMYTSDIHGHIGRSDATFLNPNFPPPVGNGASAAAYIAKVREEAAKTDRPVFLFDSGDIFQGTPVGMHTMGASVVDWMNNVGYSAMAVGNHEFDRGWKNLRNLSNQANFPMLGANVFNTDTQRKVDWLGDYVIFERAGFKFGVVGYVTETTANMAFGDNVENIEFKAVHELLPGHVKELREDNGCDFVFVLMHIGLPWEPEKEKRYLEMIEREKEGSIVRFGMNAMELAHTVWGVDAIFAGHTHTGYLKPWQDPKTHTMVFEPYANGSSIGHVTFLIDRDTKQMIGYETHFGRGALLTLFEEEIWPDEVFAKEINEEVARVEEALGLGDTVGETTVNLVRGSAENALMGFVVVDAYREECNADFAIQNVGGVRANLSPGKITKRDLLAVSPFDNEMFVLEMTGHYLKELLETKLMGRGSGIYFSGGKVRFDLARPNGDRIVSFTRDGEPVDLDATYRVAMTNYLADGNSGLIQLKEFPRDKIEVVGMLDRAVLENYIQRKGVISPTNDGRWVRVKGTSE